MAGARRAARSPGPAGPSGTMAIWWRRQEMESSTPEGASRQRCAAREARYHLGSSPAAPLPPESTCIILSRSDPLEHRRSPSSGWAPGRRAALRACQGRRRGPVGRTHTRGTDAPASHSRWPSKGRGEGQLTRRTVGTLDSLPQEALTFGSVTYTQPARGRSATASVVPGCEHFCQS